MAAEEKRIMALLYHAVKNHANELFDDSMHQMINRGLNDESDTFKNEIYEKRVLAETMISRPVMKAFKKMIRENGLFTEPLDAIEPTY